MGRGTSLLLSAPFCTKPCTSPPCEASPSTFPQDASLKLMTAASSSTDEDGKRRASGAFCTRRSALYSHSQCLARAPLFPPSSDLAPLLLQGPAGIQNSLSQHDDYGSYDSFSHLTLTRERQRAVQRRASASAAEASRIASADAKAGGRRGDFIKMQDNRSRVEGATCS